MEQNAARPWLLGRRSCLLALHRSTHTSPHAQHESTHTRPHTSTHVTNQTPSPTPRSPNTATTYAPRPRIGRVARSYRHQHHKQYHKQHHKQHHGVPSQARAVGAPLAREQRPVHHRDRCGLRPPRLQHAGGWVMDRPRRIHIMHARPLDKSTIFFYSFNCHFPLSKWVARPARVAPRGAAATTTLHDHMPEKEMFWCAFGSSVVNGRARARSFKGLAGYSTTSQAFKEETRNHAHAHTYTQLPVRADQGRKILLPRHGRHAGSVCMCGEWVDGSE